jgi:hypothetical protein
MKLSPTETRLVQQALEEMSNDWTPESPGEIARWEHDNDEVWAGPYALPRIEGITLVLGHQQTTASMIDHLDEKGSKAPGGSNAADNLRRRIHLFARGVVTQPRTTKPEEKAKQKLLAERRKTPLQYCGIDLKAELKKFLRLPVFKGTRLPALKVRHSPNSGFSGRAWCYSHRIVMTLGYNATLPEVLELLLHELVHVSLPADVHHGERFILRLCRAAREAWGVDIGNSYNIERGSKRTRAYAVDVEIRKALATKWTDVSGTVAVVEALPPPSPVDKVVRMEVLVQKRAEHAARMLVAHEARLKREQKIVSKWRTKVRYYDKVAASKRTP